MKWFKNPFKREPLPDQPLPITAFDKTQGSLHGLRRGMWVVLKGPSGKRALLTALSPEGMARIMIVHPVFGTDEIELDVPASALRQARYDEIPSERRPKKDRAWLLGYSLEPPK
jgi:hypothetical protein